MAAEKILTRDEVLNAGPFNPNSRRVLIYSTGPDNESHGTAISSDIDDRMGNYTATRIADLEGWTYRGAIQGSSDRVGIMSKDWNPEWIEPEAFAKKVISHIKEDINGLKGTTLEPTHAALVSGHGGNNYLIEMEKEISKAIGVPFVYARPFPGVSAYSEKYKKSIVISHADDGEHSIALYMGLLDKKKFDKINEIAKKDPIEALRQNPAIMGLGWYALRELSGPKYEGLRQFTDLVGAAENFVKKDKMIVADYDVGRQLMEGNVQKAREHIKQFISKN